MQISRSEFIKSTGLGLMASVLPISSSISASQTPNNDQATFEFGISSYTLRKFPLEKAARMSLKMGTPNILLKDVHLPRSLTRIEIQKVTDNLRKQGVHPYAVGEITMNTKEDVNKAFEYAQAAGVNLIVASPDLKLLPDIEKAVKKFSVIRLSIHNNGPEDLRFPTPGSAYDLILNMDDKIGLCIDVGHTIRAGQDVAKKIIKYADRLFDIHVKDMSTPTQDANNVEIGRGVANYPEIMKALRKIKYDKIVCLEIEKDEDDPFAAISESIGYVKGVWSGINA